MARNTPRHKKDTRGTRAIKISIFILILIIGIIGLLISPWGNSMVRKVSGDKDAPLDYVAKSLFIKQVEKSEDVSNVNPNILKLKEVLEETPMNEIVEAANDRDKAVELMKSKLELSDDSANIFVDEVFENEISSSVIKDISNSKWVDAYEKFNKLQSSGALDEMKENIKNASNVEAKELQDEASQILNK